MNDTAPAPDDDLVRLWWWNSGAGASCRVVHRDNLGQERTELRAMGAVTWLTDYIPVTIACE